MTHSVSPAQSAPASEAASRPAREDDQADRSSFALLLNVQLAAKIPDLMGSDRPSARQLAAQERREEQRTGRAEAQDQRARDAAARARARDSRHAAHTDPQSRSTGIGAEVMADGAGSVRLNAGHAGTFGLPASEAAAAGDAGTPASPVNSKNDGQPGTGRGPANARGGVSQGGINAILSRTASAARSADSPAGKAIPGVSSAKAGGASTAHHALSASRIAGRSIATRAAHGRAAGRSSQARPFQFDQAKVLAQVGRGLAAVLRREGGVVTLRLEPAALGKLKIRLDLNQGRVDATFRVQSESARQLLESSLDALRSSLETRGLSVDRLHVDLREALAPRQQDGSHDEPQEDEDPPGGDRESRGDGDPPEQRSRTDHRQAGGDPRVQGDAEQSAQNSVRSNAGTAEDFQAVSGLGPGADEVMVRVRLDAVA